MVMKPPLNCTNEQQGVITQPPEGHPALAQVVGTTARCSFLRSLPGLLHTILLDNCQNNHHSSTDPTKVAMAGSAAKAALAAAVAMVALVALVALAMAGQSCSRWIRT